MRRPVRAVRQRLKQRLPDARHSATDNFEENIASGVLTMGRHSYGRPHVRRFAGDTAVVHIGAFVSIAEDVEFIPGGIHRMDWVSTFPFRFFFELPGLFKDGQPASEDIVVGNDVWIATGARILSGVTIGDGAVIGAGALVSRDVRPYAFVAGNPATEIRRRFTDSEVETLQAIAWWDWEIETILECADLLGSADVDGLIRKAREFEGRGGGESRGAAIDLPPVDRSLSSP